MAYDPDTSYGGDHAYVPHVETLVFHVRNEAGDATVNVTGVKGKRLDVQAAQQEFGVAATITTKDTVWRLWDSTLSSNEPEVGDTITSGSVVYVIRDVAKRRPGPTWLCNTRARK